MYLLHSESNDPFYHAALEEFLVRHAPVGYDILLTYINQPAVIIGKNQIPWLECAVEELHRLGMFLCRRISGGGTVVHDPGNINFAFITTGHMRHVNNYRPFLQPIAAFLNSYNVQAVQNERNDLLVEGFKISGNAQFTTRGRLLSHGTLLYNSNLNNLRAALSVPRIDIRSKARSSVRSPVTCIADHMTDVPDIDSFRRELESYLLRHFGDQGPWHPDEKQRAQVLELMKEKYKKTDWVYGRTPVFAVFSEYDGRAIEIRVLNGKIKEIRGLDEKINTILTGCPYRYQNIRRILLQNVEIKQAKPYTFNDLMNMIYPFYEE